MNLFYQRWGRYYEHLSINGLIMLFHTIFSVSMIMDERWIFGAWRFSVLFLASPTSQFLFFFQLCRRCLTNLRWVLSRIPREISLGCYLWHIQLLCNRIACPTCAFAPAGRSCGCPLVHRRWSFELLAPHHLRMEHHSLGTQNINTIIKPCLSELEPQFDRAADGFMCFFMAKPWQGPLHTRKRDSFAGFFVRNPPFLRLEHDPDIDVQYYAQRALLLCLGPTLPNGFTMVHHGSPYSPDN